jgi:AraC-like DNA-binding protein
MASAVRPTRATAAAAPPYGANVGAPTTIATYALAIGKALEQQGIDSVGLFREAGLSGAYANDPLQRIPVTQMTRLFALCVEATGDRYFGLTVAQVTPLTSLHALGYSLMASDTLLDFGHRLARYFRLLSQVAEMRVDCADTEVALVATDLVETCPETQDAWLGLIVRFVRLLNQTPIDPIRVDFIHAMPPGGDAPYQAYFNCPVTFGGDANVLVFDRAAFDRKLEGSCPELAQINDTVVAGYIARLDRDDVVARVRAQIIARLDSDASDRDTIARDLGMAPATLARKLASQGSSFHDILDDTRRSLALGYLGQPQLPVTEIAFRLGFTDLSNFTRAFKRWTGKAPTAYRAGTDTH